MENIRAFIAVELDGTLRTALGDLSQQLKKQPLCRVGRWVDPNSIHMTLKFLGDVPTARVPELLAAMAAACQGLPPFDFSLRGIGCFPNLRRPRVVWVGVEEPSGTLERLQSAVERELGRLGFQPEGRGFSPHLTLARVRDDTGNRERADLGAWLGQQSIGTLGRMHVCEISLMQSTLRPTGAIYTCRGTASLQPTEE